MFQAPNRSLVNGLNHHRQARPLALLQQGSAQVPLEQVQEEAAEARP